MTRTATRILAALAASAAGALLPSVAPAAGGPEAAKADISKTDTPRTDAPKADAAKGDQRGDQAALPTDPDGLVRFVTGALRAHDEGAIERLVNWDGVRLPRRRLTLYQIRTTFGRPIKAATVEDFPADGLAEVEREGKFKPNMPVTKRLRIVFDEAVDDPEAPPTNVFLLGQKDGVYRIAVLNSVGPPVQK